MYIQHKTSPRNTSPPQHRVAGRPWAALAEAEAAAVGRLGYDEARLLTPCRQAKHSRLMPAFNTVF